jgi:hypothetical protein
MSGHFNLSCNQIGKHKKNDQRRHHITLQNLSEELSKFHDNEYIFQPSAQFNDMWVEIDLDDLEFEEAIFKYIGKLLADNSKRFKNTDLKIHCRI